MLAEASARFHGSPYVLSARAVDTTVLMDSRRSTYYTLNEVGGRVWELAGAGATVSEATDRILAEYDAPRWQVEHDVAGTVRQLLDDGLLTAGATSLPVPSVLRCGLVIAWLKVLLRIRGFSGTLAWVHRRVGRLPASSDVEIEKVKAVEYRVAMAGALYPGRAKCLEQSLTLYYLLRRHRVAARYCQGVQPYPFQAHAWIEYQGEVVNDVAEHAGFFARFPDQLP